MSNNIQKWVFKGGLIVGCLALLTLPAELAAQPVISSKGGLINVINGKAEVQSFRDMRWEKARGLSQMARGDELRTQDNSYAEVLLNPGSYVRLGPNAELRMVNDRLTDLSMDLLSGSMELEAANLKMIHHIDVTLRGRLFTIQKDGVYRFDILDSRTARARVFRGQMLALQPNGKKIKLKKSHEADIVEGNTALALTRFDPKVVDQLTAWSASRSQFLARANYRSYAGGGFSSYLPMGYFGGYPCGFGSWFYNPFFGMYTFLPGCGFYDGYFSPYGFYYPTVIVNSGRGVFRAENVAHAHESIRSSFGSRGFRGGSQPSFSGATPSSGPVASPPPAAPSMGRSEMGGAREAIRH